MGPVVNKGVYEDYKKFSADLHEEGNVVYGGKILEGNGYYAAPTIVDQLPEDHYLWKHEMFLPIVTVAGFEDLDDAMEKANDIEYGLTAGFFSQDDEEIQWFLDNIEAGVVYVNRAGCDHGCLARIPILRRMEGQWFYRQGRGKLLLRSAVHA